MVERAALMNAIKYALWEKEPAAITMDVYRELKHHAITALFASELPQLSLSSDLYAIWKNDIYQQIVYFTNYENIQHTLPITVPYVILKGTTAAQYYPHPEYRAAGDIDIMTRREDFNKACNDLLENGFCEIENTESKNYNRHRNFTKFGVVVEVHLFFALLNDAEKAKYLDDLIIENINPIHVLPDCINGLVLLEHISQHLEEGLGFRQIIDWMMFVNKCLPDEKWSTFNVMACKIGLDNLAIVTTRMCEMFLGLSHREWCASADESICRQLLDYIQSNGNFGNKRLSDADISENVFAYAYTPKTIFRLLRDRGRVNWKKSQKYKALKPFAWIYQAFRYFLRGIGRDQAASKLKAEFSAAKKRRQMFEALGIKTEGKGIVIYKDGKYVKE